MLRRQRLILGAGLVLSVLVHGAALRWLPGFQQPPRQSLPDMFHIALEVPHPAPLPALNPPRPEHARPRPRTQRAVEPAVAQPERADHAPTAQPPQPRASPAMARDAPATPATAAPLMPQPQETHIAETPPASAPDYRVSYLDNPSPHYPVSAKRRGLQGTVVLRVEVLADGTCGRLEVKNGSGHEILDGAAVQSVKSWRFAPARHDGVALTAWVEIPVTFRLDD
jgi:protein TonB